MNQYFAAYDYDDSKDENGPKETMMVACPARTFGKQFEIEEEWRKRPDITSEDSQLFFLSEHDNSNCYRSGFVPSIKKIENNDSEVKYCTQSQSEIYQVGFPIATKEEDDTEIQFLSLYKICYSNVEAESATRYSIHRIESPSLLLLNTIEELPDLNPLEDQNKSFIDASISTKELFEEKVINKFSMQVPISRLWCTQMFEWSLKS
ncbi:uncharacterized protein LOC135848224 [Planococcus citri]|uniref:uncharacterized protein LOC135848224 n=1 Tax=Planococcus citri TaxID=170843 RepID=UPI0031F8A14A